MSSFQRVMVEMVPFLNHYKPKKRASLMVRQEDFFAMVTGRTGISTKQGGICARNRILKFVVESSQEINSSMSFLAR